MANASLRRQQRKQRDVFRGYIREPTGSAAVSEPQLRPEGLLSVPAIPPVVRRGDSLLSRPAASTGRSRVVVVVRTVHLSPQTHGCADAISGLGLEQHAPRRRCPTILRVPSLPGGARAAPSRGGKKRATQRAGGLFRSPAAPRLRGWASPTGTWNRATGGSSPPTSRWAEPCGPRAAVTGCSRRTGTSRTASGRPCSRSPR